MHHNKHCIFKVDFKKHWKQNYVKPQHRRILYNPDTCITLDLRTLAPKVRNCKILILGDISTSSRAFYPRETYTVVPVAPISGCLLPGAHWGLMNTKIIIPTLQVCDHSHVNNTLLFTHWGRVTHICVSKIIIIGSDNGLSPGRRQSIIWTNAGILLIGPLGTNFIEILIGILAFSFKEIHLKMSSAKIAAILSRGRWVNWSGDVFILMKFCSLTALKMVKLRTVTKISVNSTGLLTLTSGRFEWNCRWLILKFTSIIDGWCISFAISLRCLSLDLTDDKSTLLQVMAWCRQATGRYLSQCWPRYMSSHH